MAVLCSEIWLVIGVVFVLQLPVIRSQLCQQGWTFHALTGSCMAVIRYNYKYIDARNYCETYSSSSNTKERGHLVFIFDKATDDFVKGLLDEGHVDRALIGLHDRASNGDYLWGDGSPIRVTYTGWADNPHTADSSRQAVVMTKDGWQEYDSTSRADFVCQVNVDFPTPRMVCPVAEVGEKSPDITCTVDTHLSFTITSVRIMKTAAVVALCDGRSCWPSQGYQHVVDVRKSQVTRSPPSWYLRLRNVRISDETDWACSVEFNNSGSWLASQPCSLKVYTTPADIQCSHMFVQKIFRTTCTAAKVYPQVGCMWQVKYGTHKLHAYDQASSNEVVSAEWYYRATCNASFFITNAGTYVVHVVMKPNFGTGREEEISVSVAPPQQPPQLYLAGQRLESSWVEVVENQTLNITCRVPGGDPEVYITIIECNNIQQPFESDGSSVTMDVGVTRAFHGQNCTCSALHAASYTQTSSVEIRVTYKPNFDTDYKVTTFYGWRGSTANLTCLASANEVATIKWYEIKDNRAVLIETEGPFTNREPQVWPDYYLSSSSLLVDVSDEASPVFKDYTCKATNRLGSSKQTVTLRRALPPGQPVVYIPGTLSTKVTIEIDIPKENGGQPVTGYHYSYRVDTAGAIPIENNIDSTQETTNLELTDLKPNTQYILRVSARNAVGLGTEMLVTIQTKEVSLPGKLELLSPAEGSEPTSYTLKWADVDDGDSPVTEIVIKYRRVLVTGTDLSQWMVSGDVDKSFTIVKVPNVKSTSYTMSGLERDTYYDIRITVINKEGQSPETFQIIKTSPGDFPTPRMVCPIAKLGQESPDITCTVDTHPSFTITSVRFMQTAAVVAWCDGRSCWSSQEYQHVIDVSKPQVTRSSAFWNLKLRNITKSDETNWTCSVKFNNSGSWVASQPCNLKVYTPVTPDSKVGGSQAQDVGAIVGGIVVGTLVIIIFGVLIFLWRKKGAPCKRKKDQHASPPMYAVFKNDKPGSRHDLEELPQANASENPQ